MMKIAWKKFVGHLNFGKIKMVIIKKRGFTFGFNRQLFI